MIRADIIRLIENWQITSKALDAQIDALQSLTGGTDGALQVAIWDVQEAYTRTLGDLIGDLEGFWLQWWALECYFGKSPKQASTTHTSPLHLIDTLDKLVDLILDEPT